MPAYGRFLHSEVRQFIEEVVASVPLDYGGGSGSAKALVIADLIARDGVRDTIEIGVYRGRSLLPVAAMLRITGAGVATGVDPWSVEEALQEETHAVGPEVNEWVRSQPWDETYQSLLKRIEDSRLTEHCRVLRMTSEEAAPEFAEASVDLVHIDGNHDQAAVERDVELYVFAVSDFMNLHEDQPNDFAVLRVPR